MFDDNVRILAVDGRQVILGLSQEPTLDQSKRYNVEIREWRPRRSLNQNALFHALCAEISRLTGMDRELVKQGIKEVYGPKTPGLHGRMMVKPSHLCDKLEMADLIMGAEVELTEAGGDPRKIT
jgi:hypothetical protein